MKVALVGLGYWGQKILRNLVTLLGPGRVLAVDSRPSLERPTQDLYPSLSFASSIDHALEDHNVQAVVLATPVKTHAALARKVLLAGRHVLVEKPLAASVDDARELVELAAQRHLQLMVGHTFLFSPRVDVLAGAVQEGRIGRPHYVTTSRLNLGLYRNDVNVIWDLAPHDLSIIFHVLREFPSVVQTMARNSARPGVPDVAFINLTFPSGVIASVTVSWRAPRKIRNTVMVGDKGMVVYDDTQPDEPVKIYDRGVIGLESSSFGENQLTYRFGDTVSPHVSAEEPLLIQLRHFIESLDSNEACLSDGWFGLEVVAALECADRSWQLGGVPVEMSVESLKLPA